MYLAVVGAGCNMGRIHPRGKRTKDKITLNKSTPLYKGDILRTPT